jgi:hypothetical protein
MGDDTKNKAKKAAAVAKLKSILQKKKDEEYGTNTPMVLNSRDLEQARKKNEMYGENAVMARNEEYLRNLDRLRRIEASYLAQEIQDKNTGPWKYELLPENLAKKYDAKWNDFRKQNDKNTGPHAHSYEGEISTHPFEGQDVTTHELGHLFFSVAASNEKEEAAWKKAEEIMKKEGLIQDKELRKKSLRTHGIVEE